MDFHLVQILETSTTFLTDHDVHFNFLGKLLKVKNESSRLPGVFESWRMLEDLGSSLIEG